MSKESKESKEVRDLAKALDDFRREIRNELRSLKDSMKYCSDTCDDVKDISKDVKELRREIQLLTNTNNELQTENKRLGSRVEELEQYQRTNNLEIKGVPADGDPVTAVVKIGQFIGEPINESDIDVCHRVSTKKENEKNIVVRFVQRSKRNSLLAKCKKFRGLNAESLGYRDRTPVFVNEHLTRRNKQLLGAAISRKRQAGWKYVWSSGGKIYARKDDGSDVLRIEDLDDIQKMTR